LRDRPAATGRQTPVADPETEAETDNASSDRRNCRLKQTNDQNARRFNSSRADAEKNINFIYARDIVNLPPGRWMVSHFTLG
jgi:hypothetical protein